MRFNLIGLVLLLLSQTVWSAAKIENWQTPQGSRVYYVRTAGLPMVDVRVVFDAGSARDEAQFGVAALTSALLDSGAGDLSADDIAQRFESVGANYSAGVNEDMAWLAIRTLTEKALFDKALATFETVLSKPAFNQADFEREKARTLAGLKHREESPGELAGLAFNRALYGDHPYAHPETGVVETVAGFSADDLKSFYQKYYVAANAMVVIVGDVSREQAEQTANQVLSKLPVGSKPAEIPAVTMPNKASKQHIEFPSTQTHVLVGLPGTYRKDPDYFALYVGNHILGGGSMVSRLFEEVREKRGLAYGAYSVFAPLYRQGPFMMSLQTRNDQTEQALDVLLKTFNEFLDKGPSDKELTAAKQNITGGFAMRFDTNSKLTDYVAMIGFYQQPLDYLDTFQSNVEAVSIEQIKDAFKRRVKPELLQTVTVGAGK
ncbi:insulinase family protein [Methylomonas sp. LW13]|uniref:M16 family metallopeptidase n=1 Tax=unclassified Methylomonas TaxID=2608980 RepID=UPI00051ACB98|nr:MULTISPECIES: pitrilysin family protein [unclassified Methylomonas]PKD42313.1 insulinase family protein [Methylomonas sp. Kb3]QBC25815.1 insulinase family protein [Methylomonas sp. LW13]